MSVLTMIMMMMLVQVPLHACIEARLRSLNPLMVFQITIRHSNFIFSFLFIKSTQPLTLVTLILSSLTCLRSANINVDRWQILEIQLIWLELLSYAICKYISEVNMLKDSIVYHLDKFKIIKLAKLRVVIVISNMKLSITDPLTDWQG